MCHTGTRAPRRPSVSPAAAAPASGAPVSCGGPFSSAIQILDEIGLPIAGATVRVTIGGAATTTTTDGSGIICFTRPPGTSVQVQLVDMHEARPGDSTTTPSGRHFRLNGTGP
jgi:hypothetical protein